MTFSDCSGRWEDEGACNVSPGVSGIKENTLIKGGTKLVRRMTDLRTAPQLAHLLESQIAANVLSSHRL